VIVEDILQRAHLQVAAERDTFVKFEPTVK